MCRNYEYSDNFDTESIQKLLDEILILCKKVTLINNGCRDLHQEQA